MAGQLPGFDADGFRTAIRFAMTLGAPADVNAQAAFFIPQPQTADVPTDSAGVPFAPAGNVTRTPPTKVVVPCGIEQGGDTSVERTDVGTFSSDHIVVTLLDADFAQVTGFTYLVIGGQRWDYRKELVQSGLGPVTVHRLLCVAEGSA